jgi:hypothetical protein
MKNKGEQLASILQDFKDCYFFLHNTKEFHVVENIMNEGFVFESQLSHSTDRVNPHEPIEVTYFLFQRKDYGTYSIIIAIPKIIYDIYTTVSNEMDICVEDVLTIHDPIISDNDELVYTVSPKHILGYFNQKTSEFYLNRNWDPYFNNCMYRTPINKTRNPGLK